MLYICEKPSQAKDIAGVLGASSRKDGYFEKGNIKVTWCYGHLLSLYMPDDYDVKYKKWSLANLPIIPVQFSKKISKASSKQYKVIKDLLKTEKEVVISTDSDREGEMIAREILEKEKWKGSIKRLWLHALDEASIKKGLSSLIEGDKTKSLYYAAYGRQIADWLIGLNYSQYYSIISGGRYSIGRVQTPTLKFVVDRDNEIENFISKAYFELEGLFNHKEADFKTKWDNKNEDKIYDKKIIDNIKQKLANAKNGVILNSKKEEKQTLPPRLFSLSTLQKFINNKYGYSAQEVLDTVQSLYETFKYTTYPRTDCEYLPTSQLPEAKTIINNAPFNFEIKISYGKVYQFDDSKISAHHAIIPTAVRPDINKLNEMQKNVYLEIYKRYIAMFYPALIKYVTNLEIDVQGEIFKAAGSQIKQSGWYELYKSNENKTEPAVPFIEKNIVVNLKSLDLLEKQTTPPARFTDSSLLDAMKNAGKFIESKEQKAILKETQGLGTEATRAAIIEKLIKIEYLKRNKKQLISTDKARQIIAVIDDTLKTPATTAAWEEKLKRIEDGGFSIDAFLSEIKQDLKNNIEKLKSSKTTLNLKGGNMAQEILEGVKCPLCGSKIIVFPKSISCENRKYDKETNSNSGCAFNIYESPYHKKSVLKKQEYINLLQGKKVQGKFVSKAGKDYEAGIYLNNGEVKLEFANKK
jgi:DNA topoisomerase-3